MIIVVINIFLCFLNLISYLIEIKQSYNVTPQKLQAVYYWLVCIKKLTKLNIKMKKKKLRSEYNKKFVSI